METKVGTTAQTGGDQEIIFYDSGEGRFNADSDLRWDHDNNELKLSSGSKIVFGSDTNIYRAGANTLKTDDSLVVVGNVDADEFQSSSGTAADPTFTFQSDPNTGMYRESDNVLGFAAQGLCMAQMAAPGSGESALLIRTPSGTITRVRIGPEDSAGTGFRSLRINNSAA